MLGRASPGKVPSMWWCLCVADLQQSLKSKDLQPNTKYDDIIFKFILICPITFGSLKWGGLHVKRVVILMWVTQCGWYYPKLKADSLHFSLIFIVSFNSLWWNTESKQQKNTSLSKCPWTALYGRDSVDRDSSVHCSSNPVAPWGCLWLTLCEQVWLGLLSPQCAYGL